MALTSHAGVDLKAAVQLASLMHSHGTEQDELEAIDALRYITESLASR